MDNEALKKLVAQGLAAMQTGSDVAAKATSEIQNDAKHPDLKSALEVGNKVSEQWKSRISQAVQSAGGSGEQKNPILEAHFQVSKLIRQQAPDDTSRDLGIIASGQLALHYWIAAFGTMASYTKQLGMEDVAAEMKKSANEAKQGDERHTEIAKSILGS